MRIHFAHIKRTLQLLCWQLVVLGFIATAMPGLSSAHVLRQDQGISAVLHIPPADNPIAGQPTELEIAFGDNKDAFTLADCICQVLVTSSGKVIDQVQPIPARTGATLDSVATVRFPNTGTYHVLVTGSAKDDRFHNFHLDYPVQVATASKDTSMTSGQGEGLLIVGIGSLIILAVVIMSSIVKRRHSSS